MTDQGSSSLDLDRAREVFEDSTDFTIAIEEEFALLDPQSLELTQRFDELHAEALKDPVLADSAVGELIASEIEIRSGRSETFGEAVERQRDRRGRLFAAADRLGIALGAMGTHPWASYLDQKIIDTEHYRRVEEGLRYVAWRNNTFSVHLHIGIRGADRAVAVCDAVRELLPVLLAVSANSPFLDGRDTGLHTVRTQTFTKSFPRCGVPEAFGDWEQYASFVDLLRRTGSIVESTQLWWSVRPHHLFGTVEVRICDAQTRGDESFALTGLIAACVAQAALDHDVGRLERPLRNREIEENMWRAIRHGMDGELIDFRRGELVPARAELERLIAWTAPARELTGIDIAFPEANGAQRSRAAVREGRELREVYASSVEETRRTYVSQEVSGTVGSGR